ncbi:MAG: 4-(cytidine 5'-diphospho)-2-C-methyl-D-erythritol kinase [Desulfotignum sp.]
MIQSSTSFAKINLFLYVTGKRPDGYHDLFTLMTTIQLADVMTFTFQGAGVEVTCNHPLVPEDETNLAYRAATLFFRACEDQKKNISVPGVTIDIKKNIPVGGGLGGGSSNAATVLSTLNARCHDLFSCKELMEMGRQLGADVPFFLYGRPALATGVGDQLTRVPRLHPRHVVLCDPGIAASTASVYQDHDFCLTSQGKYTIESASNILSTGQDVDVRPYLHNDLEAASFRLYPEIKVARDEMAYLLQKPVTMSGSGGSLFSLFSDKKNAVQAYELLRKHRAWKNRQVFLTVFQHT